MFVDAGQASPGFIAGLAAADARKTIDVAADQMAKRVAAECVQGQQRGAGREGERADAHSEREPTALLRPDERVDRVVTQNEDKYDGDIEEISVNVLEQQEARFAGVFVAGLADRTGGRIEEECAVIGFAIVIA